VNFAYDAAGRLFSEDYSPCEPHHAPYGAAPEVTYEYDDAALDAGEAFTSPTDPHMLGEQDCRTTNYTRGRLVAVTDRAQRSLTCYDGRGRTVEVAKRLANPGGVIDGRWYNRRATYDGAVTDSTGASTNQPSTVTTTYTLRGAVDQVLSSYGLLVDHVTRDADGLVTEIQYGDAASTTTAFTYDDLRRLRNLTTYRASLDGWVHGPGTQQMLLRDEQFSYDRVGNPAEIRDWRDPAEWPVGAKPVTRKMQYDSLYRLSRMDYQYSAGDDVWADPYRAETEDPSRPQPSPRADFAGGKRVQWQSFRYDWLGNTEVTDDDAQAFYDRSLGEVTNDGYKLQGAKVVAGDRQGELDTVYDAAGNLVQLDVDRQGDMVGGAHWPPSVHGQERLVQRYAYEWDEVGRLVRARRWDMQNPTTIPPDDADVDAELSFTYDASDQRVRKTSGARHTLYVFASLELRGAEYEAGDYSQTEVPYLFANGVRLARVVHGDSTGVYLELGDHLGSTSVVLDHATGELVQRDTAYAYGAVESSYRPEKFEEFREDYRFTGKEDDVEVGLIYFGKRYYAPLLQRWISADPLAVHAPGEADLNLYAYVHGRVLVAVDPVGLQDDEPDAGPSDGGTGPNPTMIPGGTGEDGPEYETDSSQNENTRITVKAGLRAGFLTAGLDLLSLGNSTIGRLGHFDENGHWESSEALDQKLDAEKNELRLSVPAGELGDRSFVGGQVSFELAVTGAAAGASKLPKLAARFRLRLGFGVNTGTGQLADGRQVGKYNCFYCTAGGQSSPRRTSSAVAEACGTTEGPVNVSEMEKLFRRAGFNADTRVFQNASLAIDTMKASPAGSQFAITYFHKQGGHVIAGTNTRRFGLVLRDYSKSGLGQFIPQLVKKSGGGPVIVHSLSPTTF
jgi:RHS repeat-associated protein